MVGSWMEAPWIVTGRSATAVSNCKNALCVAKGERTRTGVGAGVSVGAGVGATATRGFGRAANRSDPAKSTTTTPTTTAAGGIFIGVWADGGGAGVVVRTGP